MHQPRQRGPLPQDEEEQEDSGDADGVGDEVRRDAAVRVADVEGVGGVAARRVAEFARVVGRRRHGEAGPDIEDSYEIIRYVGLKKQSRISFRMFEDLVQTLNFPSTDFTILAFFNILSISDSEFSFCFGMDE